MSSKHRKAVDLPAPLMPVMITTLCGYSVTTHYNIGISRLLPKAGEIGEADNGRYGVRTCDLMRVKHAL